MDLEVFGWTAWLELELKLKNDYMAFDQFNSVS